MESEWITWSRENMQPELFAEMMADIKWAAEWRDKEIRRLSEELAKAKAVSDE